MKNQSPIHAFDDLRLSRILQNRKTVAVTELTHSQLAGAHRSIYMKLLVTSHHFNSNRAEEPLSLFAIQKEADEGFRYYISKEPVMKASFLSQLQGEVEL